VIYLEAPDDRPGHGDDRPSVFLAGGITGCADWQAHVCAQMAQDRVLLLNPRRADFDIAQGDSAAQQIAWEWRHLHDPRTTVTLFWFACETVQPIALFELGDALASRRRIVVGTHPAYPRRADVVLQASHFDPDLIVHDDLDAVVDATRAVLSTH
jgi:hypothetical protein